MPIAALSLGHQTVGRMTDFIQIRGTDLRLPAIRHPRCMARHDDAISRSATSSFHSGSSTLGHLESLPVLGRLAASRRDGLERGHRRLANGLRYEIPSQDRVLVAAYRPNGLPDPTRLERRAGVVVRCLPKRPVATARFPSIVKAIDATPIPWLSWKGVIRQPLILVHGTAVGYRYFRLQWRSWRQITGSSR